MIVTKWTLLIPRIEAHLRIFDALFVRPGEDTDGYADRIFRRREVTDILVFQEVSEIYRRGPV